MSVFQRRMGRGHSKDGLKGWKPKTEISCCSMREFLVTRSERTPNQFEINKPIEFMLWFPPVDYLLSVWRHYGQQITISADDEVAFTCFHLLEAIGFSLYIAANSLHDRDRKHPRMPTRTVSVFGIVKLCRHAQHEPVSILGLPLNDIQPNLTKKGALLVFQCNPMLAR